MGTLSRSGWRARSSGSDPRLIVFGGLPGTGKTTLAREIARDLCAVYLRVDTVEQAMIRAIPGLEDAGGGGYAVACGVGETRGKLVLQPPVKLPLFSADPYADKVTISAPFSAPPLASGILPLVLILMAGAFRTVRTLGSRAAPKPAGRNAPAGPGARVHR